MAGGGELGGDRFWPYARVLGAIGLVASTGLVAASFLPSPLIAPGWVRVPLFVGIFPLHLAAVLTLRKLGTRKPGELLRFLPVGARVALGVLSAAMWLTFMVTFFSGSSGTPERHGDRYYSRYQSKLTEISEDEYRDLQAVDQRRFLAIPAVFFAFGTAVAVVVPRMGAAQQSPSAPLTGNPYLDTDR